MMITIAVSLALAAAPTVADVKSLVREQLKDPQSAQFSGIKLLRSQRVDGNGKVVEYGPINGFCGFVNAKNSYGGYAGKSYFMGSFSDRKVVILDPDLSSPNLC